MKRWAIAIATSLLITGAAFGSAIKTWAFNESIKSTDLNSALSHIHGLMVGGHGARLVNADVSAGAAIAHTKLATPGLVPKAWASIANCGADPCTINSDTGVNTVSRSGAGVYVANLDVTSGDTTFGVGVQSNTNGRVCRAAIADFANGTAAFTIRCFSDFAMTTPADAEFFFVYFNN